MLADDEDGVVLVREVGELRPDRLLVVIGGVVGRRLAWVGDTTASQEGARNDTG